MPLNAREIREFNAYLNACSDNQLQGVFEKESKARRFEYVALVMQTAKLRGVYLDY